MTNIISFPPKHWKPAADEARAFRAYCARVEGRRPGQIVIEIGVRQNVERDDLDGVYSANIMRVTDYPDWDDTDLVETIGWAAWRRDGVELRRGAAVCDAYIYEKAFGDYHGGLLGNAQVYVETVDGRPRVTGFAATCHPFKAWEA